MNVVRTAVDLRSRVAELRAAGGRVGFVPTMGALHDGHLSLVTRARDECDIVVVSIFVNPTQFNDARDLAAYPRNETADSDRLRHAKVDLLFAPSTHELYPDGFSTSVDVGPITEPLEGATRGAAHFRGVATVVTKLLNLVQPHCAYFGQKDAQQLLVIRRLVRDLDLPVDIIGCPTLREADGLAMSSRNARLAPDARHRALGLSRALFAIRDAANHGVRETDVLRTLGLNTLEAHGVPSAHVDYLALVHAETLQPLADVTDHTLVAVAAHIGDVRLIDNLVLQPDAPTGS